jgi:hypothetical protein
MRENHIWVQGHQLLRERTMLISAAGGEAIVDTDIAAFGPSAFCEALPKSRQPRLGLRIILGEPHEHADAPHPLGLLRAGRERPRSRAAEQRDERAAFHSITSSASESRLSEILTPSAFAV